LILATTTVEDFDRFLNIFSTKGAEKRKQHGSKGATVFRDPNEADRVWVLFDWDEEGFQSSCLTPRFRRSFKKPGTKAGLRQRSSAASTAPSPDPESE
jgi:quinol monooxygenase YgiN